MNYLIIYLTLLALMFVFQVYRIGSTIHYVYKQYPNNKVDVFFKIIPNEMFTFNRLATLLSVITFPLVVFWWLLSVVVLYVSFVVVCVGWVVTFSQPLLMWIWEQTVIPVCRFVLKILTKDYWLGRW